MRRRGTPRAAGTSRRTGSRTAAARSGRRSTTSSGTMIPISSSTRDDDLGRREPPARIVPDRIGSTVGRFDRRVIRVHLSSCGQWNLRAARYSPGPVGRCKSHARVAPGPHRVAPWPRCRRSSPSIPSLAEAEHHWLRLLVAEWQLLADLSFSDLVLWVPDRDPNVYWAAAQIRPDHRTDRPVRRRGRRPDRVLAGAPGLRGVLSAGRSPRPATTAAGGMPVDTHAIPVRVRRPGHRRGRAAHQPARHPRAELARAGLSATAAQDLAEMITVGAFPMPGDQFDLGINPRVGDGFIRIDADGSVVYASPNALSAYRRLGLIGDLVDEHLAGADGRSCCRRRTGPVDDSVQSVLSGRIVRRAELVSGEAHLLLRVLPLLERPGAARRHRALPRRQRPAEQGAPAGHQGRDHPGDPPPGQEQPADGRGAAADAGPADRVRRRPRSR